MEFSMRRACREQRVSPHVSRETVPWAWLASYLAPGPVYGSGMFHVKHRVETMALGGDMLP